MEEKKPFSPKKRKCMKIVTAVCIVLSLCSLGILAWFVISSAVDDDGMGIRASVSPLLVISDDENDIKSIDPSDGNALTVTSTGDENLFIPCTYSSDGTSEVNLVYIENTGDVSMLTGLMKKDKNNQPIEADMKPVLVKDKDEFYADYKVYIASVDTKMAGQTLTAEITNVKNDNEDTHSFLAAAVDFYVGGVYKGTLHCKDAVGAVDNGVANTTQHTVTLYTGDIPLNTESSIEVLMRCYFDGALVGGDGYTYITSKTISAQNLSFNIDFVAADTAG